MYSATWLACATMRPTAASSGFVVGRLSIGLQVCCWQIVLQNSQNAVGSISRKWIKQTSIAERCSLQAITEVAREFIADSPSNDYLLAARTARKICIQ
jgi:hypothetical protein